MTQISKERSELLQQLADLRQAYRKTKNAPIKTTIIVQDTRETNRQLETGLHEIIEIKNPK